MSAEQELPPLKIMIPENVIDNRIKELAEQITKDYRGKDPLVVCILKGAMFFTVDLMKEMDNLGLDTELDTMEISSYNKETESSRNPKIVKDLSMDISGRNVLIIEDIIDTGWSLNTLHNMLSTRGPESIKICTLVSKSERREVDVPVDYIGFEIENKWVEGKGMDTKQKGRGHPFIGSRG